MSERWSEPVTAVYAEETHTVNGANRPLPDEVQRCFKQVEGLEDVVVKLRDRLGDYLAPSVPTPARAENVLRAEAAATSSAVAAMQTLREHIGDIQNRVEDLMERLQA
jgi:hypothetical protein